MTKYSLECYLRDKEEPLKLNLKNDTLFLIDSFTRNCTDMADLKETVSSAFSNIKPFDIMHGTCLLKRYNDDGTEEILPIIFQGQCKELDNIEVEKNTDKIKPNNYLKYFVASMPSRLNGEFKQYMIKNNYIDDDFLAKIDEYFKIDHYTQKAKQEKFMAESHYALDDYYKLRKIVVGINNYLNYQKNKFDEKESKKI